MVALKKIIFEKNYTRDTTLVLQQIWLKVMIPDSKKYLGLDLPFSVVGIDYMNEGAIEIWENFLAIKMIKEGITKASSNLLLKLLQNYEKNVKILEKTWNIQSVDSKKKLKEFILKIESLMFIDLIHTYISENKTISGHLKDLALKLRKEDHFFAASDAVIRNSIQRLYPSVKEYPTCILLSEIINDKIPSTNICKKRFSHCVVASDGYSAVESLSSFMKKNPDYVLKEYNIYSQHKIIGQTAHPGVVRGKVRIVRLNSQIRDVQQGDILVSPMTTPYFIPALQKASAIVTDEGGLTCHAAIVSRELGIPCIIGTGIATKILKTGDVVEVDADKGVVRKIK